MKRVKSFLDVAVLILALFTSMVIMAVPASKKPITKKQSNGKTLTFVLYGDEHLHYAKTLDGYTLLLNNSIGGDYVYATADAQGNLVPSNVIAANADQRTADDKKFLAGLQSDLRYSLSQINAIQPKGTKVKAANNHFPTEGKDSLLVILVEFADLDFTYTREDFENLTSQKNYGGVGSFKDYYYDQSGGKLDLGVRVVGPYKLTDDMAYYGADGRVFVGYSFVSQRDKNVSIMVREAIEFASQDVDFSHFDNNGDGTADGVFIYYAGTPQSTTGNTDEIWPHQSNTRISTYNGAAVARYACSSEIEFTGGSMAGIGTMCHEFGHMLGLPDMYDTDYESSGGQSQHNGSYDLMANGNYNDENRTPPNLSILEKAMLGWAEADTLSSVQENLTVKIINGNNDKGYYIKGSTDGNGNNEEFFMIESRSKANKWDAFLPSDGMLIYHGLHSKINAWINNGTNSININPANRGWYIVSSDGMSEHTATEYAPFNENNYTSFTPVSKAKPMLNDSTVLDSIWVTNIHWASDTTMAFDYNSDKTFVESFGIEDAWTETFADGFTIKGSIHSKNAVNKKGIIYSTDKDACNFEQGTVAEDLNLSDTANISNSLTGLSSGRYYYRNFVISGSDTVLSSIRKTYTKLINLDSVVCVTGDTVDYGMGKTVVNKEIYANVSAGSYCAGFKHSYPWELNEENKAYAVTNAVLADRCWFEDNKTMRYVLNTKRSSEAFEEGDTVILTLIALAEDGDSVIYLPTVVLKYTDNAVRPSRPEVTMMDITDKYTSEEGKDYMKLSFITKNTDKYYVGVNIRDVLDSLSEVYNTDFSSSFNSAECILPYLIDNNLVKEYNADTTLTFEEDSVALFVDVFSVDESGIMMNKNTYEYDARVRRVSYLGYQYVIQYRDDRSMEMLVEINKKTSYYKVGCFSETEIDSICTAHKNEYPENYENADAISELIKNGKVDMTKFKTFSKTDFYPYLDSLQPSTSYYAYIVAYNTYNKIGYVSEYDHFTTREEGVMPAIDISDIHINPDDYDFTIMGRWKIHIKQPVAEYYSAYYEDGYIENLMEDSSWSENQVLRYLIANDLIEKGDLNSTFNPGDTLLFLEGLLADKPVEVGKDYEIVVWAADRKGDTVFAKETFTTKNIFNQGIAEVTGLQFRQFTEDWMGHPLEESKYGYYLSSNKYTSSYYVLFATKDSLQTAGITNTATAIQYCKNHITELEKFTKEYSQSSQYVYFDDGEIKDDTLYTLYVIPCDVYGTLGTPKFVQFRTSTLDIFGYKDTTYAAEDITLTSAQISGEMLENAGSALTYKEHYYAFVCYSTALDDYDTTIKITPDLGKRTVLLDNLQVNTEYEYYFEELYMYPWEDKLSHHSNGHKRKFTTLSCFEYKTIDTVICYNSLYNGKTYRKSTTVRDTIKVNGMCDTVVTVNITVLDEVKGYDTVSFCEDYSVEYNGKTYNKAGRYTVTFARDNDCDSNVYLTVTRINSIRTSFTDTIRNNYYQWDDTVITSAGEYTKIYQSAETGCDSVVTLTLTDLSGFEYIDSTTSIIIYPNPAKDIVTLDLGNSVSIADMEVLIADTKGRIVYKSNIKSQISDIDISSLASGVYYIKVGDIVKKLIIE